MKVKDRRRDEGRSENKEMFFEQSVFSRTQASPFAVTFGSWQTKVPNLRFSQHFTLMVSQNRGIKKGHVENDPI